MSRFLFRASLVVSTLVLVLGALACAAPTPVPPAPPTAQPEQGNQPAEPTAQVVTVVATPTAMPIKAHYKVAWIPPDMFNPFWVYNRQGMEQVVAQALAEKGIKIDIAELAPIKTFDVGEQVAIFENAIQMKVDGIIVCPTDQNSLIPMAQKAKDAGIPVVALSTDIPGDATLTNVGVTNTPSAKKIAQLVINELGNKGNYLILTGIPGNLVSDEREKGYRDALAECADCKLLDVQPAYFNREQGMATMENMLSKFSDISAVFVANDEIALGAWEALSAAGKEKDVIVAGFDGNKDVTTSIKEGKIIATLDQDPWRQGADSMASLVDFWENKPVERYRTWVGDITDVSNAEAKLAKFDEMEQWFKP